MGVVDADVAAQGAPVAHLHVGDGAGDLRQLRPGHRNLVGRDQAGERDRGADLDCRARGREADGLQLLETGDVHEHVRRSGPLFHHVDERLAASENTCPIVVSEETDGLLEGVRTHVLNLAQEHGRESTRRLR